MYTSNDSNRMYLAYFILSACDILDVLTTSTSPAERKDWTDWIYHCQHPDGGFRMWPGTDFGERTNTENARWDPANINATYFALASLLILGDDLKCVNRKATLHWVCKMQRDDGSFGETLVNGKQEGGRDPRLGYCATGVRHILRGATKPGPITLQGETIDDIHFDRYIECLRRAEVCTVSANHALVEIHANKIQSLSMAELLMRLSTSLKLDIHSAPLAPSLSSLALNPEASLQQDLTMARPALQMSYAGSSPCKQTS